MNNKETIRKRVHQKTLNLKNFQSFTFFGKIVKISQYGLLVSKARRNSRFWVDISRFQVEDPSYISKHFLEGDEVELKISFSCYENKDGEYTTKIHLVDIDKADSKETYAFEFREQEFSMDAKLLDYIKTDMPNVYVLKLARLNESQEEQEIYHIRYFNEDRTPEKDIYEVDFFLKNTPNIIDNKGEVYSHEEIYEKEVDGKMEERTNKKFLPCLEIRGLYIKAV